MSDDSSVKSDGDLAVFLDAPETERRVGRAISVAMFGYFEAEELLSPWSPSSQAMKAARAALDAIRIPHEGRVNDTGDGDAA